jgi:hypothetical protein
VHTLKINTYSEKHFSQMRFSKGVIGFEYLPVSIFNLWLLILKLVKDFLLFTQSPHLDVGQTPLIGWLIQKFPR